VIGDPKEDHTMSSMLWDGWYEPPVTRLAAHVLDGGGAAPCRPGPTTVVDVGANLGWFTLLAAARGYRVVAFDVQEGIITKLRQSVSLNGWAHRVHLHRGAVGPDGARIALSEGGHNWGGVSVKLTGDRDGTNDGVVRTEAGLSDGGDAAVSLDTALGPGWALPAAPSPHERVCLLKIDVEGFEPDVLAAAAATLARTDHVIMEFRDNAGGQRALALLQAAGLDRMLILDEQCCGGDAPDSPTESLPFLQSGQVASSLPELRSRIQQRPRPGDYVNLVLFRSSN
jgi:FkbM family methyltransferase